MIWLVENVLRLQYESKGNYLSLIIFWRVYFLNPNTDLKSIAIINRHKTMCNMEMEWALAPWFLHRNCIVEYWVCISGDRRLSIFYLLFFCYGSGATESFSPPFPRRCSTTVSQSITKSPVQCYCFHRRITLYTLTNGGRSNLIETRFNRTERISHTADIREPWWMSKDGKHTHTDPRTNSVNTSIVHCCNECVVNGSRYSRLLKMRLASNWTTETDRRTDRMSRRRIGPTNKTLQMLLGPVSRACVMCIPEQRRAATTKNVGIFSCPSVRSFRVYESKRQLSDANEAVSAFEYIFGRIHDFRVAARIDTLVIRSIYFGASGCRGRTSQRDE